MRRLPLVAFSVLTVGTVGAFFVTQHLKVSTPLIAGSPKPTPAVISPTSTGCNGFHRLARFSFYLLHRPDDVAVYVVDSAGTIVRTLATSRHMRRSVRFPDGNFPWDGRTDGGNIAPDGTYTFRIALLRQGRTIGLTKNPVQVQTTPLHPLVTSVSPQRIFPGGMPALIRYRGNAARGVTVSLYRAGRRGGLRLVKTFRAPGSGATWNGDIAQRPAARGRYLVGLQVTDSACNIAVFKPSVPGRSAAPSSPAVTVR